MRKYLRVCSDLHLEQYRGMKWSKVMEKFVPEDERDAETALILAGDISSYAEQLSDFLKELSPRFEKIYYVPGNHEFYGYDINEWADVLRGHGIPDNVACPFNDVGVDVVDGIRYVYTTLWAYGGRGSWEQRAVESALRDFYVIRVGDKIFRLADMIKLHTEQRDKMEKILREPHEGQTIVITHHMPSLQLCHPRFGGMENGGFASPLDNMLAVTEPALWIHGHTHDTIDTHLYKTRILCNPSGYKREEGSYYTTYDPKKFVELNHG